MKINLNYRDTILSVPAETVTGAISEMSEGEMRVLLYLCANTEFRADTDANKARAIKDLDMQWLSVEQAISSLCARGIIAVPDAESLPDAETRAKKQRASVKADSPSYSKEETANIIDRNTDLKQLLNVDVPQLLGKAVSHEEAMIIVSMYDYLRMTPEYIVTLVAYCVSINKKSLRYAERIAFTLFDADVTDIAGLNAYIEAEKRRDTVTQFIRDLFGIGQRALIAKEKQLIEQWTDKYSYSTAIIEKAYELTIKAINSPSMSYAGTILTRWHDEGLKTLEDVEADIGKPYGSVGKGGDATSYDSADFLVAALQRSYSDNNGQN